MALTLHGTVSDNTVALDRKTATPLIINGDMAITQRGTSATGVTSNGYYVVDRYNMSVNSIGTYTFTQSTDVPDNTGLSNSFKIDCTTADASPAAGDYLTFNQFIEGQNVQVFKKGTSYAEKMTISFWVKSNKTGTYVLEVDDNDNGRNINQAYTINSANTWEKKVLSFAGDTTGAFDNDNGSSLRLFWWLGAGSDFASGTLQTSWGTTVNADRAAGNVNLADSTSNEWYITGVQLEVGEFDANSIPAFQFEDRATSLARCQRYFIRLEAGTPYAQFGSGVCTTTTAALVTINLPTTMRTIGSFSDAGTFRIVDGGGSHICTNVNADTNTRSVNLFRCDTTTSGLNDGNGCFLSASNDANAFMQMDAEL